MNELIRSKRLILNQNQFDAVCSFVYNFGIGAFKKSSILQNIIKQDYDEASKSFLLWNKSGRPLKFDQGVYNRRIMEMNIFNTEDIVGGIVILKDRTRRSDRNYIENTVMAYRLSYFKNND